MLAVHSIFGTQRQTFVRCQACQADNVQQPYNANTGSCHSIRFESNQCQRHHQAQEIEIKPKMLKVPRRDQHQVDKLVNRLDNPQIPPT
jgi:hypothetical protein